MVIVSSGKMLPPKLGLLSAVLEPVVDGRLKDINIVPVCIDYERPLETVLYSEEVLGKAKKKETLENLLKARSVLKSNFGSISVTFGTPLSARDSLASLYREARVPLPPVLNGAKADVETKEGESKAEPSASIREAVPHALLKEFSLQLIDKMHSASTVMPTHLVATLILMYRQVSCTSSLLLLFRCAEAICTGY